MTSKTPSCVAAITVRLHVCGLVQGFGVRPAVARLATGLHLGGSVRNTLAGMEILLTGEPDRIAEFRHRLPDAVPAGCRIEGIEESTLTNNERAVATPPAPVPASVPSTLNPQPSTLNPQPSTLNPQPSTPFTILRDDRSGPLTTPVPPDIATCSDCQREADAPRDRRFRYPLTTCAACGPRYTVIRAMPYERDQTALADFPLCPHCQTEYDSLHDRRFHAQTTACPACGPRVWGTDAEGRLLGEGDEALKGAVACLRRGEVLALKGIGGYQLLCDAQRDEAVKRVREIKQRPAKPLAVLVESLEDAARLAELSEHERELLASSANPIVLVRARPMGGLSPLVHPGLNEIGLMLPTTPLHRWIARSFGGPLVCTSANEEGEPIFYGSFRFSVFGFQTSLQNTTLKTENRKLNTLLRVPFWLHHDRPIERPIDDSVQRVIAGRPVTLRLARGLAPLVLDLDVAPTVKEPMLALGGHLKVAAAWSNGTQAVLGPHVGDMETLATRERFVDHCTDWQRLYRFIPAMLVHDLHPDYFTTRLADEMTPGSGRLAVQHHFAHVVAGMAEYRLLDRTVLGVAWDGTGYGTDGTVWGGEFLLVHKGRSFDHIAHVRPFRLPGGEAAIREPWRTAVSVLAESIGREELTKAWKTGQFSVFGFQFSDKGAERYSENRKPNTENQLSQILKILDSPRFSVATTSVGRLFDAAAALILGVTHAEYDGQPAMLLEATADRGSKGSYPFPLLQRDESPPTRRLGQLDWRPLFRALWYDCLEGVSPSIMSLRFHRSLAEGIVRVASRFEHHPVVLAGGVFQNRLLTELVCERFGDASRRRLHLPGMIPPTMADWRPVNWRSRCEAMNPSWNPDPEMSCV
jgi:hydrogenase maturation protein HypF